MSPRMTCLDHAVGLVEVTWNAERLGAPCPFCETLRALAIEEHTHDETRRQLAEALAELAELRAAR